MPQLNPMPWLFYLIITWLIFLFLAPKKILGHIKINEPNTKTTEMSYISWSWPWQ
uniref:ATP synthase complex subunit 8 n=1 Tax=Glandirana rugosa TaxID=8410 RepID=A0A088BSJ3_GLARU|nr:ATP synthase subunit 8 [Glandirana rugosa]BCG05717.1 ATP synthase F0 subunit 8 [Glandirana rugosa]